MKTPKFPFEINWPLANELKILSSTILKGTKNLERFGPDLDVECGYIGVATGQLGQPEQPKLFKSLWFCNHWTHHCSCEGVLNFATLDVGCWEAQSKHASSSRIKAWFNIISEFKFTLHEWKWFGSEVMSNLISKGFSIRPWVWLQYFWEEFRLGIQNTS